MIRINLKVIYSRLTYLKLIVIIGAIFFILTLYYFFHLRTKLEMIENRYLNLLTLEKKLKGQLKISSGSNYREKIKNLKNKFDIYTNDQLDKPIFHILNGKLIAPNVEISKINFLDIKNENFLISLQVENNFLSTNNVINHLNTIASLDKLILVENFRWNFLNNLPESKKQNIFFLFKIYNFNYNQKNLILLLSKILKISVKSIPDKPLIKFPLNKIKMIGFYSYNRIKNFGFVSLPNKKIFRVQLGDQLGLERGIVIGIYAQKIFILNKNLDKIIILSMKNGKLTHVKDFS